MICLVAWNMSKTHIEVSPLISYGTGRRHRVTFTFANQKFSRRFKLPNYAYKLKNADKENFISKYNVRIETTEGIMGVYYIESIELQEK